MTPREIERLKSRVADIKRIFAVEKLSYGRYPDKSGVRYLPTKYYVQLGDYTSGLTYLKWFSKNFPVDPGLPYFFFEWIIILYKKGNIRNAEKKAFETYCSNTYLFDTFFNRSIIAIDKWEDSNLAKPAFAKNLGYSCEQIELADFSEWLSNYYFSEKFNKLSNSFIAIQKRIKLDNDKETPLHVQL